MVVGDQLVTDVMGAHLLGMKAYLLAPLVEQDLPHTLLLRNVEHAIMGERQPEGATTMREDEGSELPSGPVGASSPRCTSHADATQQPASEGDLAHER